MDKLDITTSHNIVVTAELGTVLQRILATLIDMFALLVYSIVANIVSFGNSLLTYILILPILLFYHLIFEYFNNGQSLGKMLLKLRVVSLSGERPELNSLVMRWMFRLLDLTFSIGMLAAAFISSTKKKQRIGDILADTAVVRIQNEAIVTLSSIKKIDIENYAVTYPQITRYNDNDMLLVKKTINRVEKRQSIDNQNMVSELTSRISKDLKLKQFKGNRVDFLKTILNDYIILTR